MTGHVTDNIPTDWRFLAPDIQPFPTRIALELTPLCNLSCFMCPRHLVEKLKGFMDESLWKKCIDEIAEKAPHAKVLPFWRGESLLHKQFVPLSRYALDRGIDLHISTNGILLNDENSEILKQYEFVTFSIHEEKGYEKAKAFAALKDRRATVQISFVECEETAEKYLDEVTATPDLQGFDAVRLYEQHSKDGKFGSTGKAMAQPRIFCPKLLDTLMIAADGTISRCSHIWRTEADVNLNECTIQEAWDSSVMQRIREHYPDADCGPCDQWSGHTTGKAWRKDAAKIKQLEFT